MTGRLKTVKLRGEGSRTPESPRETAIQEAKKRITAVGGMPGADQIARLRAAVDSDPGALKRHRTNEVLADMLGETYDRDPNALRGRAVGYARCAEAIRRVIREAELSPTGDPDRSEVRRRIMGVFVERAAVGKKDIMTSIEGNADLEADEQDLQVKPGTYAADAQRAVLFLTGTGRQTGQRQETLEARPGPAQHLERAIISMLSQQQMGENHSAARLLIEQAIEDGVTLNRKERPEEYIPALEVLFLLGRGTKRDTYTDVSTDQLEAYMTQLGFVVDEGRVCRAAGPEHDPQKQLDLLQSLQTHAALTTQAHSTA